MGVELIPRQQPAHGIAPAGALVHAQGGAAEGEDAALHFHLRKAGVAGAEVDVRGQHQLDADGQAVALGGDDYRLAHPRTAEYAPRVAGAGRWLPASCEGGSDIGQVEAGSEVLAMGKDDRHAGVGVAFKLTVGQGQVVEQVQVEGVAFAGSVQAEQQNMATLFTADAATGTLRHGGNPCWVKGV